MQVIKIFKKKYKKTLFYLDIIKYFNNFAV